MNHKSRNLQLPGAGLPFLENAVLNVYFKTSTAIKSDKMALGQFQRESDRLLRIADEDDESYDVFQQMQIPRLMGIEDSSRNWSVLMILDHLCQTNKDMLQIIKALTDGIVPRGEIDISLYKPSLEVGFDVIERYRDLRAEYLNTIEHLIKSDRKTRTTFRYTHPWFGSLDAHQWHCLAGMHQALHRRHAQKLVAMLGVT